MAAALTLKYEPRSGLFIFNCLKNDTGMASVPWKSSRGLRGEELIHRLGTCSCDAGTRVGHPSLSQSLGQSRRCWKISCARGSGRWVPSPGQGVTGGGGDSRATLPWDSCWWWQRDIHPSRVIFHVFFSLIDLKPLSASHAGAGDKGRGR